MFGLSLVQLLVVGGGVVAGTVLMVVCLGPRRVRRDGVVGAFGTVRVHGTSLVELAPNGVRFVRSSAGDVGCG